MDEMALGWARFEHRWPVSGALPRYDDTIGFSGLGRRCTA